MTTDPTPTWPEMTDDDRAFWAPRLEEGETLLWAGRPPRRLFILSTPWDVAFTVMFGLWIVGTFTVGYSALVGHFGLDPSPPIQRAQENPAAGLLFLGFSILGGMTWWLGRSSREKCRYAITDRAIRAVTPRGLGGVLNRHELKHDRELQIEMSAGRSGEGWLLVHRGSTFWRGFASAGMIVSQRVFGANANVSICFRDPLVFDIVTDPRRLHDCLRALPAYRD
ncbi:MAG: hypothetical protein AAFR53_13340 [Pseudomonadota bacterium]